MIMGSYPCCDGPMFVGLPDRPLPAFAPENCPHCGELVWHMFSRWDPTTWTDAEFRKEFDVDDVKKSIKPRAA